MIQKGDRIARGPVERGGAEPTGAGGAGFTHAVNRMSSRDFILIAVGFGCLIGYARMVSLGFVGYLDRGVVESVDSWYVLRSACGLLTLGVLAFGGLRQWFAVGTKALLLTTAAAVAAPMIFAVDVEGGFGMVVALLGGVSVSVLMYAWMLLLSSYETRSIVKTTAAGLLLAGAVVMGVPRIDEALALVLAVAAAFIAGACLLLSDSDLSTCRPDGPLAVEDAARVPWFMVLAVLACGFCSTVLYGIAENLTWLYDWTPNYPAFACAAAAVIVSTLVIMVKRPDWTRLVWIPPLVLLALALGFSCLSVRESIQVAVGFMLASVFCSHYLHWVVFPAMFHETGVPRAFLAGFVLFVANGSLATMAGNALGEVLPHSVQNLGGVAGLMVLLLVVLAVVALSAHRRLFGGSLASSHGASASAEAASAEPSLSSAAVAQVELAQDDGSADAASADTVLEETAPAEVESPESANPADALKVRMERYVDEYGLTPREEEVALLTMQGFSCAYIAEKLVVSNSTVRFHQQNLYRKFNVHSRNELIELAAHEE